MAVKFASKSSNTNSSNTGEIRQAGTPEGAAIMTRTEDLLTQLEEMVATSIGSIFFNQKNSITKLAQLKGKSSQKSLLLGGLDSIKDSVSQIFNKDSKYYKDTYKLFKDSAVALNKLSSKEFMNKLVAENTSDNKGVQNSIDIIVKGLDEKQISELIKLGELTISDDSFLNKETLTNFTNALEAISKLNTGNTKALKQLPKVLQSMFDDLSELADKPLNEDIDKLKTYFTQLDELLKQQIVVATNAELAAEANKKTQTALEQVNETAIKSNKAAKNTEKGTVNMTGVGKFILICGITMMIGALFMMIPGMMENSLKFAISLSIFIGAVLLPISLISKFSNPVVFKSVKDLKGFVVTCGFIMLIGATIASNKKLIKNSLLFGVALSLFIAAVLTPIALYSMLAPFAITSVKNLTKLIVTCTLVMMVGALFITLGGGKLVKNALLFGAVLTLFMLMVFTPLLMFIPLGILAGWAIKSAQKLIAKCALIMMVGALFMMIGGGKLAVYSLAFGLLLAAFITAVVTPVIIFSILDKFVNFSKTLGRLSAFIFILTMVMLIGAYFMQKKEYPIAAMKFAGLLALFEAAVILPVFLFNKIENKAIKSALKFSAFVAIMAGVMVLGPALIKLFKLSYGDIWAFTGALTGFIAIMSGIFLAVSVALALIKNCGGISIKRFGIDALWDGAGDLNNDLTKFAAFVAILGGTMVLGPAIIKSLNLSYGDVWAFVGALTGFVTIMSGIFLAVSVALALIKNCGGISIKRFGIDALWDGAGDMNNDLTQFAAFVAILGGTMVLGPAIIKLFKLSYGEIWAFVGALSTFVTAISIVFAIVSNVMKSVDKETLIGFSILVGVIATAATAGPILFKQFEVSYDDVFEFFISMTAVMALTAALVFAINKIDKKNVLTGVLIAGAIALLIAAVCGAMWVMKKTVSDYPFVQILKDLGSLIIVVGLFGAFTLAIGALALLPGVKIALIAGAIVIAGISGLIILLSAAILLMRAAADALNGMPKLDAKSIWSTRIKPFFDILDEFPGPLKILKMLGQIALVGTIVFPMTFLMGRLGSAVEDMANLKVPVKWNDKGEPIKYRMLNPTDFQNAADNVKNIIMTLTNAIDDTITQNDWILGDNFYKILHRVTNLSMTEGFMLDILCTAMQSYANLLIPTKWNKEGKAVKFRPMKIEDFTNAAVGVKRVMTTLASAILETYEYDDEHGGKLFGAFGNRILEKVKKIAIAEGWMLYELSEGLQKYAQIMIPDKWNSKGIATHYKQMKTEDFTDAAVNIGAVMSILSMAIGNTWNGGTLELKTSTGTVKLTNNHPLKDIGHGWFGPSIDEIIESLAPLGELVSSLAEGLQNYAMLKIPEKWNSKGKPIKFRQMIPTDFTNAAKNIDTVLTTLSKAVAQSWQNIKGYRWWLDAGDITEMINSMSTLGNLVGNMADGLMKYSELKITTAWNSKGKGIKFEKMESKHFQAAGDNIADIMITMAAAIKYAWAGGSLKLHNGVEWTSTRGLQNYFDASEFKDIMSSFGQMGELISNIATGLNTYSQLKVADQWDSNGKPKHYLTITDNVFSEAGTNISKVLLGMLFGSDTANLSTKQGIIGAWNVLKDNYDSDDLQEIIEAMVPIGDLVSNMAESLDNYSKLQIATQWDENGKPISFRHLSDKDFEKAGLSISKILLSTLFGNVTDTTQLNKATVKGGIVGAYNVLEEIGIEDEIQGIIDSLAPMGSLIKNMAEGVIAYANGLVPYDWDKDGKPIAFRELTEHDYESAANNIGNVISTLGKSVITFANENEDWFTEDGEFGVVMDAVAGMGAAIKNIADGVAAYANGGIPVWKDGKIIRYDKWPEGYFEMAATNIGKIITCVGKSVIEVYNNKEFQKSFTNSGEFGEAMDAIAKIGNAVKGVADGVQAYANLYIPYEWDNDGKPKRMRPMKPKDFDDAKKNIAKLICTIGTGLVNAWNGTGIDNDLIALKDIVELGCFNDMIETTKQMSTIISTTTKIIQTIAECKIPTGFDKDGKAKGYIKLNPTDIGKASENVETILTQIPLALYNAYNSNTTLFDSSADYIISITDSIPEINNILNLAIRSIKNITDNTKYIDTLFNYTANYKGNDIPESLSIGYFVDLFGIIKEFGVISKYLSAFADPINKNLIDATVSTNIINSYEELNNIFKTVIPILTTINNICSAINSDESKTYDISTVLTDKKSLLIQMLSNIDGFTKYIIDNFDTNADLDKLEDIRVFVNAFAEFIGGKKGLSNAIDIITSAVNKIVEILPEKIQNENTDDGYLTSKLKPVVIDINESIKTLQTLGGINNLLKLPGILIATGRSLTILGDGISRVLLAIKTAKRNKEFESVSKNIAGFINNTVNTLDITRIDKLISLVNALNALADKTTNLDDLTNAIANNLTDVLTVLTVKMDEAKGTFEVMDNIQKKRHALINASITKIKDIMAKQIEVHVTAETTGDTTLGGTTPNGTTPAVTQQGGPSNSTVNLNSGGQRPSTQRPVTQNNNITGSNLEQNDTLNKIYKNTNDIKKHLNI